MGAIFGIVVAVVLGWIVLTLVVLWKRQERIVFQPPADVPSAPSSARRVDFPAADGHPLFGYLVSPKSGLAPTTIVVAFHGNADLSAWLVPWAVELAQRSGALVFLPEYRGYAGIPGSPTYQSSAADAQGALAWVIANHPSADIVLFGHSLGSAIASELAVSMTGKAPRSLILQSPFTSAQAMAARMLVPPLPWVWNLISRVHYDTRGVVATLDAPVWVSHGTRDIVIPVRMGRGVFAAARHPGELLIVDRAGHNDVPDVGGADYWRWLTSAIAARR